MILDSRSLDFAAPEAENAPRPSVLKLLSLRQTWGTIIARSFTDPVWFFVTDWFMLFLVQQKHFDPKNTLVAIWIPFVASDLGNFSGGGFSSWLITRGWSVGRARKTVVVFGGLGTMALIPAIFTSNLFAIAGLFAFSTFAYAAFSTMALVLPADLYQSRSVATVSGLCGAASGLLTTASSYLIGWVSDRYSFTPILIGATILPFVGAALVLLLVRNTPASGQGVLRKI